MDAIKGAILANGPSGYWPLINGDLKNYGSTGSSHDAVATGSPVDAAIPFPAGGRAPYLPGSAYYGCGNNSAFEATAPFTAIGWGFLTNGSTGFPDGFNGLMSKRTTTPRGWWLNLQGQTNGTITTEAQILNSSGANYFNTNLSITPRAGRWGASGAEWVMWAIVHASSSDFRLYTNAQLASALTSSSGTLSTTTNPFRIGQSGEATASTYDFIGGIAHVALFNKELTADQLARIYRAGIRRPIRTALTTRRP